jgi:hypothetical protein
VRADAGLVDHDERAVLDVDLAFFDEDHGDAFFHGDGFEGWEHSDGGSFQLLWRITILEFFANN